MLSFSILVAALCMQTALAQSATCIRRPKPSSVAPSPSMVTSVRSASSTVAASVAPSSSAVTAPPAAGDDDDGAADAGLGGNPAIAATALRNLAAAKGMI